MVGVLHAGEGLKVLAHIVNDSSRAITPKYCVYRKHSFFASGSRNHNTKDLIKEVGEPIPASTSQNVTKVINIPQDAEPSILSCSIIKAEYRLRVRPSHRCRSHQIIFRLRSDWQTKQASLPKCCSQVYLDVKYASDPEIKFPIVILAAPQVSSLAPPPAASDFGCPYPPAWGFPPAQQPAAGQPLASNEGNGLYPPLSNFNTTYQWHF